MAKMVVEDCRKLTIYFFKPYLQTWNTGTVTWSRAGQKTGSISYQVKGDDQPSAIRFFYTITRPNDEKVECDYQVQLDTSILVWGGVVIGFYARLMDVVGAWGAYIYHLVENILAAGIAIAWAMRVNMKALCLGLATLI